MRRLLNLAAVFWVSLLIIAPAQAEVRVLTSIKPLQLIAAAVQDGVGTPEVLLPPGASPHNYALRPSDVRRVQEVELLYFLNAPYVDRKSTRLNSSHVNPPRMPSSA